MLSDNGCFALAVCEGQWMSNQFLENSNTDKITLREGQTFFLLALQYVSFIRSTFKRCYLLAASRGWQSFSVVARESGLLC